MWQCLCSCGQSVIVRGDHLQSGATQSCGCLNTENRKVFADLTGRQFGRLTVMSQAPRQGRRIMWQCQCSCGRVAIVAGHHLKSGAIQSCNCLNNELKTARAIHGKTDTSAHRRWAHMMGRCYNPSDAAFSLYGGRGIAVCDRWHEFVNFYADMGDPPPGRSIDRIDNHGNYEPRNCRWATPKEQVLNSRRIRWLTHAGETLSLAEWTARLGLSATTISNRIDKLGWPLGLALTTPRTHKSNSPFG